LITRPAGPLHAEKVLVIRCRLRVAGCLRDLFRIRYLAVSPWGARRPRAVAISRVDGVGGGLWAFVGPWLGGDAFARVAQAHTRRRTGARVASAAFMELIEERFEGWGLTPAECDVALFALKGFTIAEIAQLRETSEGTVKAQTNAIYRKAGVSGRPQLLGLFVEDLMGAAVSPDTAPR
jgi:DNA-binding CsgD family transcriptional regulator